MPKVTESNSLNGVRIPVCLVPNPCPVVSMLQEVGVTCDRVMESVTKGSWPHRGIGEEKGPQKKPLPGEKTALGTVGH